MAVWERSPIMQSKVMPSWVGDGIVGKWHRSVSSSESVLRLSGMYLFLSGSDSDLHLLKLKICFCPEEIRTCIC